jgi:hypothetical protein
MPYLKRRHFITLLGDAGRGHGAKRKALLVPIFFILRF